MSNIRIRFVKYVWVSKELTQRYLASPHAASKRGIVSEQAREYQQVEKRWMGSIIAR